MIISLYSIKQITETVKGKFVGNSDEYKIKYILIDSRKILHAQASVFFALPGERHDGHEFIAELYDKGIRCFVVSQKVKNTDHFPEGNFIEVRDTLKALQDLCASHRSQFDIPVIGVTGSNGKTIVKEWLHQLLHQDKKVARSPKSYNSQVGVPLSVWQMQSHHELAIMEAGISLPGEMECLQKIIAPTIGVFTNIGFPHDEGFENRHQKIEEKLKLFTESEVLIYSKDYPEIEKGIKDSVCISDNTKLKLFSWSKKGAADLKIQKISRNSECTEITAVYKRASKMISIPFTDDASIENVIHCWSLLLYLGCDDKLIAERFKGLASVAMRMELKEGVNNCTIINDSYNSDLGSLEIALDFLNQQKQNKKKVVILSDILQSGKSEEVLYQQVSELLSKKGIDRFMGIGEAISRRSEQFIIGGSFYKSTDDFLNKCSPSFFHDEIILLKGAREFKFEKISRLLQQKAHETVLEVNLDAIVHNLNMFRSMLDPGTMIMAMVKAFSYGSGSYEVANVLQFHRMDYLAVAYADEGIELRKAGIIVPIMVVNPEEQSVDSMIKYNLEPQIYSFHGLDHFVNELKSPSNQGKGPFPIHIKLETGMNRLGFDEKDLPELIARIQDSDTIFIKSVFSHLAASEDPNHDDFSDVQISRFKENSAKITSAFDYPILRHILNSSGIIRFPDAQFEMVRLGIGLYGVDTAHPAEKDKVNLQNVSTLKSTISQIKVVPANSTIGYGRKGVAKKDMRIAIVPIGYADGLNRKLGQRKGQLFVNGSLAPIVGDICMDMCMIDISGIEANEGDEVIIFGEDYTVTKFAKDLDTIPYEVLTSVSRRVKRVYYHE